ncbi:MAG: C1 family peptidase [Spirochaetes bacterium]|nr:C1 family peptidase [Spirochaetota bacterium]
MKFRVLLIIICLLIVAGIIENSISADNQYMDAVLKLRGENKAMVEALKTELKNIQNEIRQKNYKFKVGITEAFKCKISEINGFQRLKKEPTPQQNIEQKNIFEDEITRISREKKPVIIPEKRPEEKPEFVPPVVVPKKEEECECNEKLASWDWRDRGAVTDVQFQGVCGCCWAFAAVGALESNAIINYKEKLDFSEQYFVNCIKYGCNGGNSLYVFEHLKSRTVPMENQLPYAGSEQPCKNVPGSGYYAVATGYVGEDDYEDPGEIKIKRAICKYGPIVASMRSTRAFHAYTGGIYDEIARGETNHAVLIVGWDDAKKSYIVKNSWGRDWGENGFVWMDYKTNTGKYARWVLVKKK